jgi:hypothetical protein
MPASKAVPSGMQLDDDFELEPFPTALTFENK